MTSVGEDSQTDNRSSKESTPTPPDDSSRHAGAFFSGAQHFVVAGGTFTSNIFNSPSAVPSDFRRIPRGDVDLRNEIRLDSSGFKLVDRKNVGPCARRMYSARVEGKQSDVTVIVYQGQNAEEEWKREVVKNSGIWHPNFVQLYGIVSSSGIYATIFHDELVPAEQYMEEYEDSASVLSTVYLYTFLDALNFQKTGEFNDAITHFRTLVGNQASKACSNILRLFWLSEHRWYIISFESLTWIRRSTGRLCVELSTSGNNYLITYLPFAVPPHIKIPVLRGDKESAMISTLSLEQYHCISFVYLGDSFWLEAGNDAIPLGAIFLCDSHGIRQIAHIPYLTVEVNGCWKNLQSAPEKTGSLVITENGWTRFMPPCDSQTPINLILKHHTSRLDLAQCWLSQANYIFRQYVPSANYEEYSAVLSIEYQLTLLPSSEILPEGYLFLCPLEDLKSEDGAFIDRPKCPAYWSLDPSGYERLSSEEASAHGFPSFQWERKVFADSLDERVYVGLSQFHAGKGFDPYSQDVDPLYEISCDPGPCCARIEEVGVSPDPDLINPAMGADDHYLYTLRSCAM
ncbi:hypothetical protein B0H11DRAFT_2184547 [Mycena galericulata]|nr:hypothetical protein B0H11DRAFT_2184547 [Mycena galericulata]